MFLKLMLIRLFFLLMGISFFAHSQALRVRVCDAQGQTPVAYALLTAINRTVGWNTDSLGYFEAPAKLPSTLDSIRVSAPGYQPEIVDVRQGKDFNVSLQRNKMERMTIINTKSKQVMRLGAIGNFINPVFGCYADDTSINEISIQISNPKRKDAKIIYVKYLIRNIGIYNTPFRVRVYKNEGDKPGQEITNDNIIARAYAKNAWNTFDVSRYNLYIPKEGCFVAMEWLNWGDPKYQYQVPNEILRKGVGPTINLTDEFPDAPCFRRSNDGVWFGSNRIDWNRMSLGGYNPMISLEILTDK